VAAAPHRDLEVMVAGITHGGCGVGGPAAPGDQSGAPIDGVVPHGSGRVVVGVVSGDQLASETGNLHCDHLLAEVPTRSPAGVLIGPRPIDRTTLDRGCEVNNLDFTADGRGATLAG
jgi:hypothetical protein